MSAVRPRKNERSVTTLADVKRVSRKSGVDGDSDVALDFGFSFPIPKGVAAIVAPGVQRVYDLLERAVIV